MHRGQHADAQIVGFALDLGLDAAVLRPAFFGDVDLAHDLDAGNHRGEQPPRRTVAFDQDAVDAVADADAVGERLDMDVAAARRDRLGQDQVDQLDDGGVVIFLGPGQLLGRLRFGPFDLRIGEFGDHRVDRFRFGLAIVPVDGLDNLFARSEDGMMLLVQDELKLLQRVEVGRIAENDFKAAVLFLVERNDDVFAGHGLRHESR